MLALFFAVEAEAGHEKFELIYTRWKSLMLSRANTILRDWALAEDAVSEAFIRAYKNLRKLDDPESGRTAAFLLMIVKNVSLTMLEKQRDTEDLAEFDRADDFDLEQTVIAESAREELMTCIDRLSEELKTPFLLKYAYDCSLKEIGKLLKISENNAAVRIYRARAKLADMLTKGGYALER